MCQANKKSLRNHSQKDLLAKFSLQYNTFVYIYVQASESKLSVSSLSFFDWIGGVDKIWSQTLFFFLI